MGNKIGKFKCKKCGKEFEQILFPDNGWYIICPFGCTNKIKYDLEKEYESPHYYHVWLNCDNFSIGS